METLVERLKQLNQDGYNENLSVLNGGLYSSKKNMLPKHNLKIDKTFRIEDDSDPMNQTILYALSCQNPPTKGVLINSYGPYSEPDIDQFISDLSQ